MSAQFVIFKFEVWFTGRAVFTGDTLFFTILSEN